MASSDPEGLLRSLIPRAATPNISARFLWSKKSDRSLLRLHYHSVGLEIILINANKSTSQFPRHLFQSAITISITKGSFGLGLRRIQTCGLVLLSSKRIDDHRLRDSTMHCRQLSKYSQIAHLEVCFSSLAAFPKLPTPGSQTSVFRVVSTATLVSASFVARKTRASSCPYSIIL